MPGVLPGPVEDKLLVGSWFSLDLPKVKIEGITEISGLSMEVNAAEVVMTTKAGKTLIRKVPGAATYGEITVKRQLTKDKSFYKWVKDIRDGHAGFRADGSIVLHDIANKEVGRWTFSNAWPSKWSASDLDAGTDDPMMEEVTLQIELLKRVS